MSWIDVFLCNYIDAYLEYRENNSMFRTPEFIEAVRTNAAENLEARIREIIAEEIARAKNE